MKNLPLKAGAMVATAAFALVACVESVPSDLPLADVQDHTVWAPQAGHLEVCKVGGSGSFTVVGSGQVNSAAVDPIDEAFNLSDGDCQIVFGVFLVEGVTTSASVTITETPAAGFFVNNVVDDLYAGNNAPVTTPGVGNPFNVQVFDDVGHVVTFFNSPEEAGEGCTPGYWKQPHHFDSYPAGFSPNTNFLSATTGFTSNKTLRRPESGNAAGLTILEALRLRGGQQNALIRHAAAAILNANHAGVSYDLTPLEVQNLYNVAMDKDPLASANEQGCPLN